MIHSMTGFANAAGECGGKRINLDLRAVNHRYLDVQFRMPDDLRHLESSMRETLAKTATRGKVECRIQVQTIEAGVSGSLSINQPLVDQLAYLNKKWRKQNDDLGKLTVADILHFPGVITSQSEDEEAFEPGGVRQNIRFGVAIRWRLAGCLRGFDCLSRPTQGGAAGCGQGATLQLRDLPPILWLRGIRRGSAPGTER